MESEAEGEAGRERQRERQEEKGRGRGREADAAFSTQSASSVLLESAQRSRVLTLGWPSLPFLWVVLLPTIIISTCLTLLDYRYIYIYI